MCERKRYTQKRRIEMPCFSCTCFNSGTGRNGEKLEGGKGYCVLNDQEYWYGHECSSYAPTWYGSSDDSPLKEPRDYSFFDIFKAFKDDENEEHFEEFEEVEDMEEETEEYDWEECDDAEDKSVNEAFTRVKDNIEVETNIFDEFGIEIKYNVVKKNSSLHLNFELINTLDIANKVGKYNDLTIKANVYDKDRKLISIEECWIDYGELESGYVADCFYLYDETAEKAAFIKIYAIQPEEADEVPDFEVRNFSFVPAEKNIKPHDLEKSYLMRGNILGPVEAEENKNVTENIDILG